MHTRDYVQATYETIRAGKDPAKTLSALSSYLEKRGLIKLYPSILRGLSERVRRGTKSTVKKVIVARKEDFTVHEASIREQMKILGGSSDHDVRIDPHIIGGFIIESSDKRVDQSYKRTLLHAYHRVTE